MSRIILDLGGALLPGCISIPLKLLAVAFFFALLQSCFGTFVTILIIIVMVATVMLQLYGEKNIGGNNLLSIETTATFQTIAHNPLSISKSCGNRPHPPLSIVNLKIGAS